MKLINILISRLMPTLVLVGAVCGGSAYAAILSGTGTDAVKHGSELLLVVWDPVAEVSYTKDIGMTPFPYTAGDKFTDNFFVNAQQDAGYQKFFAPLNTDVNFLEFRKASINTANQVWGIYANTVVNDGFTIGDFRVFTTLNSEWIGGGDNPEYTKMRGLTNQQLGNTANNMQSWMTALNLGLDENNSQGNKNNKHFKEGSLGLETFDYSFDGSSYDLKGSGPYFVNAAGLSSGYLSNDVALTTNKVGNSSWFYYLTISGDDSGANILVDEFDNLTHDAYWGLAKDTNGDYILSFTMEGVMTPTSSANGFLRRNLTDYAAQYGMARQLSAPVGEFLDWTGAVTAVPEPGTYGLFALGLGALGLLSRRRRRQAKQD